MAINLRTRTRDMRVNKQGSLFYNGTMLWRTVAMGQKDTCIDSMGKLDTDNPLELTHDIRHVCLLNGSKFVNGVLKYQFSDYPASWNPPPFSVLSKYPTPTAGELGQMALRAAARTNPSVPHLSVPTFVGELRDIPGMIRGWGRLLKENFQSAKTWARALADGTLTWKFGLNPLIGDLRKMASFAEAIQQRIRWLQKLQERKCLYFRCSLEHDESDVIATTRTSVQSLGGSVMAYRDVHYTKEVWASTRWNLDPGVSLPPEPTASVPKVNPNGMLPGVIRPFSLAERLVYGFTAYEAFATLWELTPWSWFVDWFAGVGDWIAAHNNSLPLRISNVCVMRHCKSMTKYRVAPPPYTDTWITVSGEPWTEVEDRKERHICANPSILDLFPSLPCLTTGQLSILESLMQMRFSKRAPTDLRNRFLRLRV